MTAPVRSSPDDRKIIGIAILLLILLGAAAYANSLRGPFVFDDIPSILENPTIRDLSDWRELLWPTDNNVSAGGRPVLNVSLALNYAVSGYSTWSYHLLNAVIHLGAGLLLFGWLRRTLRLPGFSERVISAATPLALAISAWWIVHPLQTEAVTYTVQRAESLMGFFFLLTCYAFTRGVEAAKPAWLAVSVVALALALGTKEVAAVAPLLIWIYDRTFFTTSFREAWQRRRWYYVALWLLWLVVVMLFLRAGGNRAGQKGFGIGVSFWSYGSTQFEALLHYLKLSVWPFPLVFEYGTTSAGPLWRVILCASVVLGLMAIAAMNVWRRRPLGVAGAWFFGILAPTSLTPGASQMLAEQRMYLPLAAVLTVTVVSLYAWRARVAQAVTVLAVLISLALTIGRNVDYRTAISLWSDTIVRRPENGRAHGNLAQAYAAEGRNEEAMRHYREAARLMSTEPRFPYNYAVLLVAAGKPAEAIEPYREALRVAPDDAKIHNNLAVAYAATADIRRALVHASVAVHLQPSDAELRYNRAYYLFASQRGAEAIAEYEAALRLQPDYPEAHTNLGNVLLQFGRVAEALPHYESAAKSRPTSPEAQGNAAVALLRLGRVSDAQPYLARVLNLPNASPALTFRLGRLALQLSHPAEARPLLEATVRATPNAVEPRLYLAESLYKTGDTAPAASQYEEILRLDPRNEVARSNLATLRARRP